MFEFNENDYYVFELLDTLSEHYYGFMMYNIKQVDDIIGFRPVMADFSYRVKFHFQTVDDVVKKAKELSLDYLLTFEPSQELVCSHMLKPDMVRTYLPDFRAKHENAMGYFDDFENKGMLLIKIDDDRAEELNKSVPKNRITVNYIR